MDFPNDTAARNIDDQFMFGPAFLVNPVTRVMYHIEKHTPSAKMFMDIGSPVAGKIIVNTKTESRDVYLPKAGGWYDFWTGEFKNGGEKILSPAPIEIMPLYVRAGSIIPMGPFIQYASEKPADPIELRVYPGAGSEFTLYEDDGLTYQYEKGKYAVIPIKWDDKKQTLTIGARKGSFPGMLKSRAFDIVWVSENHGVGLPVTDKPDKHVTYTGKEIKINK
jgi:alpha-D-xyloside xylohydrolase